MSIDPWRRASGLRRWFKERLRRSGTARPQVDLPVVGHHRLVGVDEDLEGHLCVLGRADHLAAEAEQNWYRSTIVSKAPELPARTMATAFFVALKLQQATSRREDLVVPRDLVLMLPRGLARLGTLWSGSQLRKHQKPSQM